MKRIRLFEFEDLKWFPVALRNYMTDFLQFGANAFNMYKDLVPVMSGIMKRTGKKNIIDLGSGGGGGLLRFASQLKSRDPEVKILLTDLFPNIPAFTRTVSKDPETFSFLPEPLDARKVPANRYGIRTLFLSFHHFPYEDAKMILQDAVNKNMPVMIVEIQQRNFISLIPMILSPLNVLLTTLFIRPFRIGRMLFTYIIPVLPVVILWDGIVSILRTYSIRELASMTSKLTDTHTFDWEIRVTKKGPGGILYLTGVPRH